MLGQRMRGTDMAMYICSECDSYVDNDYHPCTEDKQVEFGLLCPECAIEREEREYEIAARAAQHCVEKGLT